MLDKKWIALVLVALLALLIGSVALVGLVRALNMRPTPETVVKVVYITPIPLPTAIPPTPTAIPPTPTAIPPTPTSEPSNVCSQADAQEAYTPMREPLSLVLTVVTAVHDNPTSILASGDLYAAYLQSALDTVEHITVPPCAQSLKESVADAVSDLLLWMTLASAGDLESGADYVERAVVHIQDSAAWMCLNGLSSDCK